MRRNVPVLADKHAIPTRVKCLRPRRLQADTTYRSMLAQAPPPQNVRAGKEVSRTERHEVIRTQHFVRSDNYMASQKKSFRVVTRMADGNLRIKDYPSEDSLHRLHTQVGVDDCSTDLSLRGLPVFRGLVGPMPEGKGIVRYEAPEVFESRTKDWSAAATPRRTRRRSRTS